MVNNTQGHVFPHNLLGAIQTVLPWCVLAKKLSQARVPCVTRLAPPAFEVELISECPPFRMP
eukprot:8384993-Alexandrium_andersonii.AAC.1